MSTAIRLLITWMIAIIFTGLNDCESLSDTANFWLHILVMLLIIPTWTLFL